MPTIPLRRAGALTLLLLPLAAAGCGSSSKATSTAAAKSPAAKAPPAKTAVPAVTGTKVVIANFKYKPATLAVKAGQAVSFTNTDSSNHTATLDQGSGTTGNLPQGKSGRITFAKAGTYAYHCDFHPFMHGKVVVR